jgi:hypothetical protein
MATTIRDAFLPSGVGGHTNLALDSSAAITLGANVTLGINPALYGTAEAFLPNNGLKVRMVARTSPGSIPPVLKKGASVS